MADVETSSNKPGAASSTEEKPNEHPAEEHDRQAQAVDHEEAPRLPFPVIGIGASAGGLEAFIEFFEAMPADPGVAFVLIQHLPPDRESMLAEILSKHTNLPVAQVRDGVAVKPNHVYVIRPGHTLGLAISKEVVELHSGTIHAESAGQDQGATFVVRLPANGAEGTPRKSGKRSLDVSAAGSVNGAHILLVEDEAQTRAALVKLLRKGDASVAAVATAADAMETFEIRGRT